MGDLLNLSWTVFSASLETISRTVAVANPLSIIQDSNFDTHFFNIQIEIIASCQKMSDRTMEKRKH